jgi:hypothetical protein
VGRVQARDRRKSAASSAEFTFFAMDLPHSDASFAVAYPAETTAALQAAPGDGSFG